MNRGGGTGRGEKIETRTGGESESERAGQKIAH